MKGRRFQDLAFIVYDPETEQTFRRSRRQTERATSNTQPFFDSELEELSVHGNQSSESEMVDGEEEVVLNNQRRPIPYTPTTCPPSFYRPNTIGNFTLTPQLLNMVPLYHGLHNKDPYLHIQDFFELCTTQQIQGVTPKGIRLRLFPFSL